MHIDYKTTVWMRIPVDNEEDANEIIKKLEEGMMPWEVVEEASVEVLYDTEEFIPVEENDGQSTIELYDYDDIRHCNTCIWDNSYQSEVDRKLDL